MITLTKRRYSCKDCGTETSNPTCIKDNRMVQTYFSEDRIPKDFSINKPYTYESIRDEYDIPSVKIAVQCVCSKCNSANVELIEEDKWENVLNFYPSGTNERWYRGLLDIGS